MALYFVAARLVELQLELMARGGDVDLSEQMATTREVLVGTRSALITALAATEAIEGHTEVPNPTVSGPPNLQIVDGGRSQRRRGTRG